MENTTNINFISVLDSPAFTGVGKKTAFALLAEFGARGIVDRMKKKQAEDFTSIRGISKVKADNLVLRYAYYSSLVDLAIFLDDHGFTRPAATKFYRVWGDKSISVIKKNPYLLLAIMSWEKVDQIGLKMGNPFHPCRVVGAIEWCMYQEFEEQQHTCTDHDTLSENVQRLIGCDVTTFRRGLKIALKTKTIIAHLGMYQIPATHWYERLLEKFLADNPKTNLPDWRVDEWLNKSHHSELTHEQRAAVKNALQYRISAYCGRGGRGKTWTLTAIVDGTKSLLGKERVVLAAVASKAVRRMQTQAGHPVEDCKNIAELIYVEQPNSLRNAMIIIDEASMLSLVDAFRLIRKLPYDTHIVFLGDHYQIPSIGAGKLFYDIVSNNAVPNIELTISQRHDVKTDNQLNMVLDGKFPVFDDFQIGSPSGLYRHLVSSPNKFSDPIKIAEDEAIKFYREFIANEETAQIISPLRDVKYPGSSDCINNKAHVSIFGVEQHGQKCVGTPVVWTKRIRTDSGAVLSNGSVGFVQSFCGEGSPYYLTVVFDHEGVVSLKWQEVQDYLDYSYCLSVHRAQGSEWENVIIVLPQSKKMIDRNMVYTALSRCKKRAIILYSDHTFVARKVSEPPAHERRRSLFLKTA